MLAHQWPLADVSPFDFSPTQRELLKVLVDANGKMVSTAELKARVWGREKRTDGLVKIMIHHIRKRLGTEKGKAVVTAWGGGYRWLP